MITCFAHKQHQKVFVIQNTNGNNKKKKETKITSIELLFTNFQLKTFYFYHFILKVKL